MDDPKNRTWMISSIKSSRVTIPTGAAPPRSGSPRVMLLRGRKRERERERGGEGVCQSVSQSIGPVGSFQPMGGVTGKYRSTYKQYAPVEGGVGLLCDQRQVGAALL